MLKGLWYSHANVTLNGKAILVYGGWNPYEDGETHDADMIYGDSFVLNTEAWSWITWSIS